MLVAISFSLRARGRQCAARGHDLRVGRGHELGKLCLEVRCCGERLVVQERDLDGREIALEHAQLVDAAADRRLLAETRAESDAEEWIEHVGASVNGRIVRVEPVALDARARDSTVQVQREPGCAAASRRTSARCASTRRRAADRAFRSRSCSRAENARARPTGWPPWIVSR